MRFGAIVESHDAPAEADEQVGTERDEGPKGKLTGWGAHQRVLLFRKGKEGGEGAGKRKGW